MYRKGNCINEADPLSRRLDFFVRELSATMTWWNGDLPDGDPKPVFPGDVTDVHGCSVHVSSPPVPDDLELSTDLLDRIRRGYEADPFYRQSSTLPAGAASDSRFAKDETGMWM